MERKPANDCCGYRGWFPLLLAAAGWTYSDLAIWLALRWCGSRCILSGEGFTKFSESHSAPLTRVDETRGGPFVAASARRACRSESSECWRDLASPELDAGRHRLPKGEWRSCAGGCAG